LTLSTAPMRFATGLLLEAVTAAVGSYAAGQR
jgi:hypothetical protein